MINHILTNINGWIPCHCINCSKSKSNKLFRHCGCQYRECVVFQLKGLNIASAIFRNRE